MADNKMEKDMPLKTKLMGFDKKSVMDFVEDIQAENQKLKRIVVSLGKENELLKEELNALKDKNDELTRLIDYSSDNFVEVSTTYEDLRPVSYEDEETVCSVQAAVPKIKTHKKANISVKSAPKKVKLQKR